ncbi:MAG: hypothetical protein RLZZ399_959 [Verrucomicrobiota bacterium]|jgi:L-fucose mutarotase
MLKGIPPIFSPEMLKVLMEMGHGDELVIADGNFPAAANARRLLRCDGHSVPALLDAILQFFPLDTYVEKPVTLMATVPGDSYRPTIWPEYAEIVRRRERAVEFEWIDRVSFYQRTREAYAVVATAEKALYANMILKKGVLA